MSTASQVDKGQLRSENRHQTQKQKPKPWPCWAQGTYDSNAAGLIKQIEDFIAWVSPTKEEGLMRKDVVTRIENLVKAEWPGATVEVIGSCSTNLCVPTSDIDLVIFGINEPDQVKTLYTLSKKITPIAKADTLQVLASAKVPIIKMTDLHSGADLDISLAVVAGKENTQIVNEFVVQFPILRPLTLLIKYYLKQRMFNNPWSGGLGSYTLVVMIISYLQLYAKIGDTVAHHLVGFFWLYGKIYDYEHNVICVNEGGKWIPKSEKNWENKENPYLLSVEDPHNIENDIGALAFKIDLIKKAFSDAYDDLTSAYPQFCRPVHPNTKPPVEIQTQPHTEFQLNTTPITISHSSPTSSSNSPQNSPSSPRTASISISPSLSASSRSPGSSRSPSSSRSPPQKSPRMLKSSPRDVPDNSNTNPSTQLHSSDEFPALSKVLWVHRTVKVFRTQVQQIYGESMVHLCVLSHISDPSPPSPVKGRNNTRSKNSNSRVAPPPPTQSKKIILSDFPDLSLSNLNCKSNNYKNSLAAVNQ